MMTSSNPKILSDLAIPPGDLLEEELEAIGMTQQELAMRTGRPAQVINEIIRGKKAITYDTAIELEKVLGISADTWVNLESLYHLTLARIREREALRDQQDWLKEFPVRELEKREWIPRHQDKSDKVRTLLEFLGVASFHAWQQTVLGFRVSDNSKVSSGALAAWLQRGEIEGRETPTEKYDEKKFRHAVRQIREMTTSDPEQFEREMKRLCADAGVAVVFVRELPKSGANGVARWLASDKGLIQLSLKWKWSDVFWFSFFHECCHILNHKVREVYIDGLDGDPIAEAEANKFAGDLLIPTDEWNRFLARHDYSEMAVRAFASEIGIHTGIVVGRMQHEGLIPFYRLSNLKERFTWTDAD